MDTIQQNGSITSSHTSVRVGSRFAGCLCENPIISSNVAGKIMITGKQDIDEGWMSEVKSHCVLKCPYLVPRVTWEADRFSSEVFDSDGNDAQDLTDLKHLLADISKQYGFDGFVFEFGFSSEILPLMMEIRSALGDKQIILVTHPEAGEDGVES